MDDFKDKIFKVIKEQRDAQSPLRDSIRNKLEKFRPHDDADEPAQKPLKKPPPIPPKPDSMSRKKKNGTAAVNAIYYPSWKMYKGKPPSCLKLDAVTHVFYAFVRVNTDGTLRLLDQYGDMEKKVDGETGCLAAFAKMKRDNPHVKTLVSIGGGSGSDEFPEMAANKTSRDTFSDEVRRFVETHKFDGIDIDWEHPTTAKEGANFLKLVQAARSVLPSPRYLITSALPTGQYCLKNIDLESLAKYLDFLNLMAYDFVGGWTEVAGNQAQLHPPRSWSMPGGNLPHSATAILQRSSADAVEYITSRDFPAEKILMGIPAYARYFPKATALGMPNFNKAGELDYEDFPEEWIRKASIDDHSVAASFVDGEKGFVSYDVPDTVREKARWSVDHGLGGMFYWTGSADRGGRDSLVTAGWEGLQDRVAEIS